MCRHLAVFAAADRADSLGGAGRRAAVAILGFRMAGVTLTDSGVGLFIAVLRPSAPVVVQRIAGEEGCLIRRALGAQTADCAGLVVDRLFRAGGGGFQVLCIHGLRREIVGQLFAILSLAYLADGFCGAGCRAAGVFRLIKHRAAGADLPVFRFVGFPVVALVVMGVALSIEHGQGLASCGQIFAFVCPRVSIVVAFASLEQRQHRVVGEVCGGFGLCFCNVAITIVLANCVQVRTGKIVAVFYSAIITANDFANSIITFNRSNIVAIGDRAHVKPRNTASFINCASNCANIIAVDDSRIVNITASNTANIIATAASNAAIVAAIFNRRSIQSAAHNAADVTV